MRLLLSLALLASLSVAHAARDLVIVTGAPGGTEFASEFQRAALAWAQVGADAGFRIHRIDATEDSRGELERTLQEQPREGADLWLVLIGHGSFDGRNAKFNLAGDDLSAPDLEAWLEPFQRRVVSLNFFSASGTFLPALAGENRVVLTSTRGGGERNYSRLGTFFAEALTDPSADLDADGTTSLLELAITAHARTAEYYESEKRILTEHGLLDDNGDAAGRELGELSGSHPPAKGPDGKPRDGATAARVPLFDQQPPLPPVLATRRTEIEARIATLKAQKSSLNEGRYYADLEALLMEMAALYDEIGAARKSAQSAQTDGPAQAE